MKLLVCLFVLYIANIRVDGQFYYRLEDTTPSATQLYKQNQQYRTQQPLYGSSQYQELNTPSQTTAYSQYPQPQRYVPVRTHQTQAEAVVAPVQHSTVIHHTPYQTITGQSPPFMGRYIILNGKAPHVHVQPLSQQKPRQPLQHPLQQPQHPHYYQQRQQVNPSPQYPNPQGQRQQVVPIRNPIQHQLPSPVINNKPESEPTPQKHEEDKESEDIEEENEDSEEDEEKGNLNEEAEESEDEEDSNDHEQYQDENEQEVEEEDNEDQPKYTNYSFQLNSPQIKKEQNQKGYNNQKQEEDEEEENPRGSYRTHEDVEEDEEEDDSNEGSSKINYSKYTKNKKTPHDYTKFAKFESRPPLTKYLYTYPTTTHTYKNIKTKQPKKDTQGKSSENIPIRTTYKEKWYITKKTDK